MSTTSTIPEGTKTQEDSTPRRPKPPSDKALELTKDEYIRLRCVDAVAHAMSGVQFFPGGEIMDVAVRKLERTVKGT